MNMNKSPFLLFGLIVLASLACKLGEGVSPVATNLPLSAEATAIPLPPPTATVEVTGVLPASLYFVSAGDNQIWRLQQEVA